MAPRFAFPFILATLLVTLVVAEPGGDAPNDWSAAADAPLGQHEGTLDGADWQDWYRFAWTSESLLRLTLSVPGDSHVHLLVLTDDGGWLDDVHVSGWSGEAVVAANVTYPALGGALRVGVENVGSESLAYTLTAEEVARPDYVVSGLTVTPLPVGTDAAALYTGTLREVAFDVTNVGGDGWGGAEVTVATQDGVVTRVGGAAVALAQGESTRVVLTWDALRTGTLGDARVTAAAAATWEVATTDNAQTVDSYGLAYGTGVSRTLGADAGACNGYLALACYGVDARPAGVDAYQATYALLVVQYAFVGASTEDAYVGAFAGGPFVFVGASVDHNVGAGGRAAACAFVVLGACQGVYLP